MCRKLMYFISLVLIFTLAGGISAQDANVNIRPLDEPGPVLDGVMDEVWSFSTEQSINITIAGTEPDSSADCSGSWWALWDWEYLYLLVDAHDDALVQDSDPTQGWLDDRIEVFIDGENNKGTSTDESSFQYCFRWNHGNVEIPVEWYNSPGSLEGVEYAVVATDSGYLLEIALPWLTMIGRSPPANHLFGIDVVINDDDDGGDRDTQVATYLEVTDNPHNPSLWGTAKLIAGKKASGPNPANGSLLTEFPGGILGANLSWQPGISAASHDVYFGDNYADIEVGTGETFRGNQTGTYFLAGYGYTPNDPAPTGFVPGTTYYWRIDEVEADGVTKYTGDVWSFTIPSTKAYNPTPADGAKFIDIDTDLSWEKGLGAIMQTVYIGDDYNAVSNATTGGILVGGATTYDPGTLELEKLYYWRVDTDGVYGQATGDVWSLTTARLGGGVRGDYYHWTDPSVVNTGDPGPAHPFQMFVLSRTDPQIDFSWGNGSPDASINVDDFSVIWAGEIEAAFTETYTFYTNTDDGVKLWVDGKLIVDNWTNHATTEDNGTIDLVAGQQYSLEYWFYERGSGAVAELRWSSDSTPKQLVPQAALSPPIKASGPSPANGATGVKMTPTLTWNAGDFAVSHQVYFGTDTDAVLNATTASPEYIGTRALGNESYNPGKLAWDTTYYWRIDEVNTLNPDSPWIGNLWSFTTGDFLVVDNFDHFFH